jgi:hypothetical protein
VKRDDLIFPVYFLFSVKLEKEEENVWRFRELHGPRGSLAF